MADGSGADAGDTLMSMLNSARPTAPITCGNSSYSSSFLRDLLQISITVVVTCIVLAVYRSRRGDPVPDVPSTRATLMTRQHGKIFRRRKLAASAQNAMSSLVLKGGQEMNGAFLSSVVALLWHHLNVAVSNSIKEILDPLLISLKVPMHFVKLDLGDVPIRTENMYVHPRAAAGASASAGAAGAGCAGVQIDLDVVWDGNPDVMLQATLLGLSGSKASANVTFGVKRIKLTGRMHILLSPLTTELPVVSAVQYGFTNPPQIELEFAGFAQSIAKQFAFVEPAIMSIVQSSLASMLVLPYRMIFPIDLMSYDYLDTYQPPAGMIRISVESGRGFSSLKKMWGLGHDIPDMYCMVSLGASSPFRTSTQWNNLTPSWLGETSDFVLYDLDQKIYVQVLDDGLSPIDSGEEIGRAEISARHLFTGDDAGTVELELTLNDNLPTGCYVTISAEMFTLSDGLHSLTSSNYEGGHHVCGLVAVIVTRAFDVPLHKEDASTYVKVVSRNNTFVTPVVTPDYPDNLDPVYSSAFHIPLTVDTMKEEDSLDAEEASSSLCPGTKASRANVILTKSRHIVEKGIHWPRSANESKDIVFTLMNDNSSNKPAPSELGSFAVTHDSLLRANNHTITEIRPIGTHGASLGFRVVLSGMQSEEEKSRQTEEDMIPPHIPSYDPFAQSIAEPDFSSNSKKQNIRVTVLKGRGFSVKARNILIGTAHDINDIYCCIRLVKSSQQQQPLNSSCWRTSTIRDDTMPQWNEAETFATTDTTRDSIRVDAYNENQAREDEFVGSAEYPLNTLLRKRLMEVELNIETKPTGSFVTLKCVAVSALAESDSSSTQQQSLESNSENNVLSQLPTETNSHEKVPRYKSVRRRISSIPRRGRDTLKRTVYLQSKGKANISPQSKRKANILKSFS